MAALAARGSRGLREDVSVDTSSHSSSRPGVEVPLSRPHGDAPLIGERMLSIQEMTDLSHAERTLLSVFAYYDGPGGCYPAIKTIAKHCGISVSWAKELLKSIKVKGRIRWQRRRRASSIYWIQYDAPILEVRELQTSSIESRSPGITQFKKSGNPDHEQVVDLEQEKASLSETIQRQRQEAVMRGKIVIVGWCRNCGADRPASMSACIACGVESEPFVVREHEQRLGVIELPFGVTVEGLDSIEARRQFLSTEGQAALHDAYRVVLGELDNGEIRQ